METAPAGIREGQDALARFIEEFVREIEPLHRAHNEALWQANTTGDARYQQDSGRLDTQIRMALARREPFEMLRRLSESGSVPDSKLARQLVLLLNDHLANQISPERIAAIVRLEKVLESRFSNFRATFDGRRVTDNELRDLLRDSPDGAERRRAWEASKQIGAEVAPELLELVGLRNQAARSLGFDNYYTMMLELGELGEATLFAVLDELEWGTREPFAAYKRALDAERARAFGVSPDDLRPWHYCDPFFQEAPTADVAVDVHFSGKSLEALTEGFFNALGFDIRGLLDRADLYERPGKNQHAFCLAVDRGADVRVLCNLRSNEYWMATMLHEFGHAVYDQHIDPSLPYLLRAPAHILVTEASAMLFGRLSKNAAWLERYGGVASDEAHASGEALARATRTQLLVQTRWNLVMCHMERALYRDPGQDLDTLWWDLVERFQGVRRPERRHAPDWASKIHFSVAPVYYQNYMLGEMTASHLQAHLLREVLGGGARVWERYVSSPEVGEFLRERLYRPGKSADWQQTVRNATGRDMSPAAFVEELTESG